MTSNDFKTRAAVGHMPFKGHRTVAEFWADEERRSQLGWCPAERREDFRKLRQKCNSSAEARRLIEEQIATDSRRSKGHSV